MTLTPFSKKKKKKNPSKKPRPFTLTELSVTKAAAFRALRTIPTGEKGKSYKSTQRSVDSKKSCLMLNLTKVVLGR